MLITEENDLLIDEVCYRSACFLSIRSKWDRNAILKIKFPNQFKIEQNYKGTRYYPSQTSHIFAEQFIMIFFSMMNTMLYAYN